MNFHQIQVMLSCQAGSYRDSVYPIISLHARPNDQDEVPHILPAVGKHRNIHPTFSGATTRSVFNVLTRTYFEKVEDAAAYVFNPGDVIGESSAELMCSCTDVPDNYHSLDLYDLNPHNQHMCCNLSGGRV